MKLKEREPDEFHDAVATTGGQFINGGEGVPSVAVESAVGFGSVEALVGTDLSKQGAGAGADEVKDGLDG